MTHVSFEGPEVILRPTLFLEEQGFIDVVSINQRIPRSLPYKPSQVNFRIFRRGPDGLGWLIEGYELI